MVVQRKWMYLESIFIGGDIRAQLPEEAKKFDAIDKTFKKVRSWWYNEQAIVQQWLLSRKSCSQSQTSVWCDMMQDMLCILEKGRFGGLH